MEHRLAFVTGATSGIGEALCKLLADKKIDLIITGRSVEKLRNLQQLLSARVSCIMAYADLKDKNDLKKLTDILHARCPDLIINNAGYGIYGEALTFTTEEQLAVLEVNGNAVLELTLEGARTMFSNNKPGVILNVSSAAAFQIIPTMTLYSAAKALVNHFSQSLDFELRPYNIRVLTACPGMVDTQFQNRAGGSPEFEKQISPMSPEYVAEMIWKQIQDQKPLKIMDWKYAFLTTLSRLIPRSWLAKRLSHDIMARIKPRNFIDIKK